MSECYSRFGLLMGFPGVHVDPVAGARLESAGTHPPRLESNTIGSLAGLAERAAIVGCVVDVGIFWACAPVAADRQRDERHPGSDSVERETLQKQAWMDGSERVVTCSSRRRWMTVRDGILPTARLFQFRR